MWTQKSRVAIFSTRLGIYDSYYLLIFDNQTNPSRACLQQNVYEFMLLLSLVYKKIDRQVCTTQTLRPYFRHNVTDQRGFP